MYWKRPKISKVSYYLSNFNTIMRKVLLEKDFWMAYLKYDGRNLNIYQKRFSLKLSINKYTYFTNIVARATRTEFNKAICLTKVDFIAAVIFTSHSLQILCEL